jgi:hypothetical protein
MSVYFVYRSHYQGPTGKFVRRFDDPSLLAWFRKRWRGIADPYASRDYAEEVLGCRVYGFSSLFGAIAENDLPPPATAGELAEVLEEHLYVESEVRCRPHVIQALTDDDEIELAYFFFDDAYLARHPEKAAFLLHEPFALPETAAAEGVTAAVRTKRLRPAGPGKGTTYLAFLAYYDSSSLSDMDGAYRLEGVRLPDLAAFLRDTAPKGDWPLELVLLRTQISVGDRTGIAVGLERTGRLPMREVSDAAYDSGMSMNTASEKEQAILAGLAAVTRREPRTDAGRLSTVQASPHVAQLAPHVATWGDVPMFHRWILFDDLWLAAHPDLGNAILRYASRWDMLT